MPQYEVVVRVLDVAEADPVAARRSVEDRLRAAGIARWQISNVAPQGIAPVRAPVIVPRRQMGAQASYAGGTLLIVAVVVWAIWFLWMLSE